MTRERRQRHSLALRLVLLAALAEIEPAAAQVRIGVRAGVTGASNLVRDSIVESIDVRPGIAPSLGFVLETDLAERWRLGVGFGTAWTHLSRHSAGGSAEIVRLTTWTPAVSLGGVLAGPLGARVLAGAVAYDPDHTDGNIFAGGSPFLPLVGAGVTLERTLGNAIRYTAELGYDFHRFVTSTLRDEGFTGAQGVHRVTVSLTISRIIL